MLFHVHMTVNIPPDVDAKVADALKLKEKEYSQKLQREGKWKDIWRITGLYENISIFEVSSPEELHEILMNLPLLPYLDFKVTSLCRHGSAIAKPN